MADTTNISWTDATFNPWTGCTKVSPGCDHCYAESWSKRAGAKVGKWGPGAPRVRTTAANWRNPVKWNAEAFFQCPFCPWRGGQADIHIEGGTDENICPSCATNLRPARRRVFCASLADVFDNEVDPQWRVDLFRLIKETPNLDWLLLTKRIGNAISMLPWMGASSHLRWLKDSPPWPNVWLGATIVNQEEADRDIPKLLATPARVRFLSMEPLLGPVDLTGEYLTAKLGAYPFKNLPAEHRTRLIDLLDWVIVGGESGHGSRLIKASWALSLRDQCNAAGVPYHFKQWGGTDKKEAGRLLDGRKWNEFPEVANG